MPDAVDLPFVALVAMVAVFGGATASVVGFGIGSLLTPILALRFGTETAILLVAVPHLVGSILRGWRLRLSVDRKILVGFGALSAVGGLVGALVFSRAAPAVLTPVLGALLIMTAAAGILGIADRWQPRGPFVWGLGLLSGFFGGVVGNQGGLRAAALSAFRLSPTAFVATSTMVGVAIDLARTPIYLLGGWERLGGLVTIVLFTTGGVVVGTLVGERILFGISRERFRIVVSVAVGILGIWFLVGWL